MDSKILSQKLEKILHLESPPVAVKIIRKEQPLPNIKLPTQNSRYCQLLMLARQGQTLMLTPEKIACPAAKAALGLGSLAEKISSGRNVSHNWTFRKQRSCSQNNGAHTSNKRGLNKGCCSWTFR
jgi:uncharacterized protein (DUF169 family)